MALGDVIADLTGIEDKENYYIGATDGSYLIALYNSSPTADPMDGADSYKIYEVATESVIKDDVLPFTGGVSLQVIPDGAETKIVMSTMSGTLEITTLQDMIDGTINIISKSIGTAEQVIDRIDYNGLDYSNSNCRLICTMVSMADMSSEAVLVDVSDYTIENSYSPNSDVMIDCFGCIYSINLGKTFAVMCGYDSGVLEAFMQTMKGDEALPSRIVVDNNTLTNNTITDISTLIDLHLELDSDSGNILGNILYYGHDNSDNSDGQEKYSGVLKYDFDNDSVLDDTLFTDISYNTDGTVTSIGVLKGDSESIVIANKNETEIVNIKDTDTILFTTENLPTLEVSDDGSVLLVAETLNFGTQDSEITSVKLYEGIVVDDGPNLTFPTEENIYFFDDTDTLITVLDVGQLSPIKDTDIYPVKIATNITTDTFESITLGTTENSVDCLLSSTQDPFESLEQITIPFTNEDITTIYLKLSTDEVQTVGNASLELLVVGNLAT